MNNSTLIIDTSILLNQSVFSEDPIDFFVGYIEDLKKCFGFKGEDIYFALDGQYPTMRHVWYEQYKANRPPKTPEFKELKSTIENALFPSFGNRVLFDISYEADDIIASFCKKFKGERIFILSKDMDLSQLVNDKVTMLKDTKMFTLEHVTPFYVNVNLGVHPNQVADLKGLSGDPGDNYKGVPGIGNVKASALLRAFGNIETLYDNILTDAFQEEFGKNKGLDSLLLKYKKEAFFCKKLATLIDDIPLEL